MSNDCVVISDSVRSGLCALYANAQLDQNTVWSEYEVGGIYGLTILIPKESVHDHEEVVALLKSRHEDSDILDCPTGDIFEIEGIKVMWVHRDDSDEIVAQIQDVVGSDLIDRRGVS